MNTNADTEFMRVAIEAAHQGHAPYGAAFVRDGQLVAVAANSSRNGSSQHAEMNLIAQIEQSEGKGALRGGTVYTTGEPCPMCAGALVWAGVDRVVYALSIDDISQLGHKQIQVTAQQIFEAAFRPMQLDGGVLREEAEAMFRTHKT